MKNLNYYSVRSAGLIALFALSLIAGCSSGKWDATLLPETENPVAPTVTALNPGSEATDVATTTAVTVTFSTAMNEASINDATFHLTDANDNAVAGDVTYSAANMTGSFIPSTDLLANTTYTATVTTDAQTDDGEALANARVWTFTTAAEDTNPDFITVTENNPTNENSNVCINKNVNATFSEELDPASIVSPAATFTLAETDTALAVDGVVSLDADGTTATFTPNTALDPNVDYTASITNDAQDLNGKSLENDMVWTFTTKDSVCQDAITLGATAPYSILSNTGVTLGGGPDSTTGFRVEGNVGIFPEGACIGCDTTTVNGLIAIGNSEAEDAMIALEEAYNEATNRTTNVCTLIDSGILTTNPSATCGGGADGIFAPGLYWSSTSIAIPAGGTITLDGGNDNDAVFIFQSETTINTIGGDTHMILINGAQAKNVFWVAQSSATIGGENSDFSGTILALIKITVNTGTDMIGRALASGAEVVVQDEALITVPAE